MANAFTHYWTNQSWEANRQINDGERFDHDAGNDFKSRGVHEGDFVYAVTNRAGKMFLLGRMVVNRIVGQKEAQRVIGEKYEVWEAREHLLGRQGTVMEFDLQVPDKIAQQLRFGQGLPLIYARPRILDEQTLRGVRRLTLDSAALLDSLLQNEEKIQLAPVEALDELEDNFNSFQRDARRHTERAIDLLRKTRYWVRESNSLSFGPSKFLGFKRMDFLAYDLANRDMSTGAPFQGSFTRQAIERVSGRRFQPLRGSRVKPDARFITECLEWGERLLGLGAFGHANPDKWSFLTVALPGRESTSEFPDEITQPEKLPAGASKTVTVNIYERNPAARRACISHYGPACRVCDIRFCDEYGEIGEGFIHVHHLKPVAQIGPEYQIDPIADLRTVCPNCHAMLHRQDPPLTIEELKRRRQQK